MNNRIFESILLCALFLLMGSCFRFAKEHSHLTFLVTRIGCGIAGFRDEEIAPLFTDAIDVENIILPKEFVACLVH